MIVDILEEHAGEAAFLWTLRDGAATAPHYDLASLASLDERVEAHVDGLRVGDGDGLALALAALAAEEPGEVFTATLLAIERRDEAALAQALEIASSAPALARAAASAFGWAPVEAAAPMLDPLLVAGPAAALRRIGLAGSVAHRRDLAERLARATFDDDPRVSARALRAVGELGRADLAGTLQAELRATDGDRRFWAAWSAAILGLSGAAPALLLFAREGGAKGEIAAAVAARRLEPREARAELEGLGAVDVSARAAAAAMGALGDPASIPWLLERLESPALARVAAAALSAITGVAVEGRLAGAAPGGFDAGPTESAADERVAPDPDRNLPWPNVEAVREAVRARASGLPAGVRFAEGEPMTAERLRRARSHGSQVRRASAALDLAMLRPGEPLFETRAPGFRQLGRRR